MNTVIQVATISEHHRNAFLLLNMQAEQHLSLKLVQFDFGSLSSADTMQTQMYFIFATRESFERHVTKTC